MKQRWKEIILVSGVCLLAAALRIWTVGYDLPAIFHPDEPVVIIISQTIFKTGDLNPHFFHYPSLPFYLHALAYAPYYTAGRLAGLFAGPADIAAPVSLAMGITQISMPSIVWLGRGVSVLFGVGSVLLVYLTGRRLTDRPAVGVLAATMLAVSPSHIYHSRVVTPDVLVTFFTLLTLYFCARVWREGRTWQYVAAGAAIGLTAGSKYNGALVGLILPVAHFLRTGPPGWKDYRLYLAAFLSAPTFLLTTPYAVLDYGAFSEAIVFDATHYGSGHAGMEGDTLRWYLLFLWSTANVMPLLALAQMARGVWLRSRETLLLAVFPVVYFTFMSRFIVRNDRTILPLVPFLFLLAAILLVDLARAARRVEPPARRRAATAGLAILIVGMLALPARQVVADSIARGGEHSGKLAATWIADNLPPGARIALESYGPYIDPALYAIEPFAQLIDNSPEWYVERGFEYLVFSRGAYGRYFADPQRYRDQVARYDEFFDRLEPVRTFQTGKTEIRIYRSVLR